MLPCTTSHACCPPGAWVSFAQALHSTAPFKRVPVTSTRGHHNEICRAGADVWILLPSPYPADSCAGTCLESMRFSNLE